LDLITVGSATLLFEEAPVGGLSAFRLSAVPMSEILFEAGPDGQIDGHFRERSLSLDLLQARFPGSTPPQPGAACGQGQHEQTVAVVEAVLPHDGGLAYLALRADDPSRPALLATGRFENSPFISFRWVKGAGEIYGRSPVMTALPDIKTVNKVVELVLKNASIAVTGIWLADDDGVLNPANIKLVPGSIIPKAVGSSGLTPLQAPGRFDVSNLVLEDLRARIRHTLLVDRLGPVGGGRMTATEVVARASEMTRLLGATYGAPAGRVADPALDPGDRDPPAARRDSRDRPRRAHGRPPVQVASCPDSGASGRAGDPAVARDHRADGSTGHGRGRPAGHGALAR
jgi:Bacteriophage head to tail connecting protein